MRLIDRFRPRAKGGEPAAQTPVGDERPDGAEASSPAAGSPGVQAAPPSGRLVPEQRVDQDVFVLEPGTALDAGVIDELARSGADLSRVDRIEHFLLVPTVAAAVDAAGHLDGHGFETAIRTPQGSSEMWTVVAARADVAVTEALVAETDRLFTEVAGRFGGSYDGWDATV